LKLFLQFLAFVLVIVALVWAKKHFFDKPPEDPVEIARRTMTPGVTQKPAAAPEQDQGRIATLINQVFHGGSSGTPEDKARIRMKAFMQAWKEGGTSLNDAEQAAACLWSRGKIFIPNGNEIQDAYNGFTKFRREKDVPDKANPIFWIR
jgi:hypothetical protein